MKSVTDRIEEQLNTLREMQAAGPRRTGMDRLVNTLEMAKARIERLQREIELRLPSEAEIALQLLPAVIQADPHCDWERQSQEAFSLAETFIATKEQRK